MNVSTFSRAFLDNYVCGDCGYVEMYVLEKADLKKIKEKWKKLKD